MSDSAPRRPLYVVRPRVGIGPVDVDMTRPEALERMKRIDPDATHLRRWGAWPEDLMMHEASYQVHFDDLTDTVAQVQVAGLSPDGEADGLDPPIKLLLYDIDLFRTPALEVVELIDALSVPLNRHVVSDESIDWPHLGLSMWRSDDSARLFESISVLHERLFDPAIAARQRIRLSLKGCAITLWDKGCEARAQFDTLIAAGDLKSALDMLENAAARERVPTIGSSFWASMSLAADGLGCGDQAARYRERICTT